VVLLQLLLAPTVKKSKTGVTNHSPVNFKICKQNVVKRREHGQHVGVLMQLSEILAMLIHCPGFVPASGHTWVVLPVVEKVEMIWVGVVDSDHRKMLVEVWYPPAVNN
jgi:hypothetical protein